MAGVQHFFKLTHRSMKLKKKIFSYCLSKKSHIPVCPLTEFLIPHYQQDLSTNLTSPIHNPTLLFINRHTYTLQKPRDFITLSFSGMYQRNPLVDNTATLLKQ